MEIFKSFNNAQVLELLNGRTGLSINENILTVFSPFIHALFEIHQWFETHIKHTIPEFYN